MDKAFDEGIPDELKDILATFDTTLSGLETGLQPLLSVSRTELMEKLSPLDCAKMDLVAAYSINSLFWMYLNVCGVNPKDHPVKQELERIRSYMGRIKEAQERLSASRLDKDAAKRFIKSALWKAAHKKAEEKQAEGSNSTVETSKNEASSATKRRKRKH